MKEKKVYVCLTAEKKDPLILSVSMVMSYIWQCDAHCQHPLVLLVVSHLHLLRCREVKVWMVHGTFHSSRSRRIDPSVMPGEESRQTQPCWFSKGWQLDVSLWHRSDEDSDVPMSPLELLKCTCTQVTINPVTLVVHLDLDQTKTHIEEKHSVWKSFKHFNTMLLWPASSRPTVQQSPHRCSSIFH